MKLDEIKLERPVKGNLVRAHARAGATRLHRPEGIEHLGGGQFGTAVSKVNNPNVAYKIGKLSGNKVETDGFIQYLLACKKYSTGNPYMPRIYSLKVFEDPKGYKVYHLAMERLHNADTISVEEWPELLYKMFNIRYSIDKKFTSSEGFIRYFVDYVDNALTRGMGLIKDPALRQTLQIIKSVLDRSGKTSDVHHKDLMCRRTTAGPQIVIIDPIYDR